MTNDHLMPPVHPGEVLAQEYLAPLGVTQHHLAVEIGLPPRRINEIVHGKRGISAGTALRLARFFGTSEWFWLNLQSRHDLGRMKDRLAGEPDRTRPLSAWARINPGSPASRTPSPAAPRSCSPARADRRRTGCIGCGSTGRPAAEVDQLINLLASRDPAWAT
jgi:addiction module HigA family antidote